VQTWHAHTLVKTPPELEKEFLKVIGKDQIEDFLDIGTGTGRILELLAARVDRGMGIDVSSEMLTVARANLENANLRNVHVRQGDMYNIPVEDSSIDVATLHLVLHYSDNPAMVIEEATRVLRPNGRLIIVDFETHHEEQLRQEHKHHRLGFDDDEISNWLEGCGMQSRPPIGLQGNPLTVKIWSGDVPVSH